MGRLIPVALAVAFASASGCVVSLDHDGYIEHEEKRFDATSVVDLHLYTFDGSVEVRTWDRPEVVVDIQKRGQDKEAVSRIEVLSERTGNRIQIEARKPGGGGFVGIGRFVSSSAKLVASVPRNTDLVVRSGDGSILVERVNGRLELRTSDGSIRATETSGELLAESGDGTIQLEEVAGVVEARTDDGSVRLTGTPAVVRARTGDGGMTLRIRGGAAMTGDWTVTTGDGSISMELPDEFDADIEADPGSDGRARSELALTDVTGGTREQRVLRGRLGQGGHRLTIRTGDGSIRLLRY
ncbi:MAG: DUF4097 family beta strand repeat-containing protein [Vicinamibacterales bacterium]